MTASPTATRSPDHTRLRNEGEAQEVRPEDMELTYATAPALASGTGRGDACQWRPANKDGSSV